jgi:hypothetical protein
MGVLRSNPACLAFFSLVGQQYFENHISEKAK